MTDSGVNTPTRKEDSRGRAAIRLLAAGALVLGVMPLLSSPSAAATHTNPERIVVPRGAIPPGCPNTGTGGGCEDVAEPYPSEIAVTGETGTVSDVNVTLNGLWQNAFGPADLDIMVVSPSGTGVMIMSDACGGPSPDDDIDDEFPIQPENAITLTFDDEAGEPLPADTACISGTFQTTDDDDDEHFSFARDDEFLGIPDREAGTVGPAPTITNSGSPDYTTPDTSLLSAFDGQAPNGTWSLYVIDDWPTDPSETPGGAIEGGWTIDITTDPTGTTSTTGAPTTTTTQPEAEFCNGLAVTIVGTEGPDRVLYGTEGDDVIAGLGGDDAIGGLGGNDTICAGEGNDSVDAGDGQDKVFGGPGNDELRGGIGGGRTITTADMLFGEEGNDILRATRESFTSFLVGREQTHLHGGTGDDRFYGGRRTTIAFFGTGTDAGNDQFHGWLGQDIVNDPVQEGDWVDTGDQLGTSLLLTSRNSVEFLNGGIVNGGNARDSIARMQGGTFYGNDGPDGISNFDGGVFYGGAGDDDEVTFMTAAATFYGGAGPDVVSFMFGGTFHGGADNDGVAAEMQAGTFYGGEADDFVNILFPPATFYGGPGNDTVTEDRGGTFIQEGPAGEDPQGR